MTKRLTISSLFGASALMLLLACGGGGGGSKGPAVATGLSYTDPTSGTFQLKKNATLSTATKLVLDLVAVNAGSGAGAAFHLTADTNKVTWTKVQDSDADYVRNGAVFDLGSAPQALKAKVSGNILQVVVSQKGTANSQPLNGTLATVALSLKSGVTVGAVTLDVVSGKAQVLMSTGATDSMTITKGTLAAQ